MENHFCIRKRRRGLVESEGCSACPIYLIHCSYNVAAKVNRPHALIEIYRLLMQGVLTAHQKVLFTENLPSDIVECLPSQPSTCRHRQVHLYRFSNMSNTQQDPHDPRKQTLLKLQVKDGILKCLS